MQKPSYENPDSALNSKMSPTLLHAHGGWRGESTRLEECNPSLLGTCRDPQFPRCAVCRYPRLSLRERLVKGSREGLGFHWIASLFRQRVRRGHITVKMAEDKTSVFRAVRYRTMHYAIKICRGSVQLLCGTNNAWYSTEFSE